MSAGTQAGDACAASHRRGPVSSRRGTDWEQTQAAGKLKMRARANKLHFLINGSAGTPLPDAGPLVSQGEGPGARQRADLIPLAEQAAHALGCCVRQLDGRLPESRSCAARCLGCQCEQSSCSAHHRLSASCAPLIVKGETFGKHNLVGASVVLQASTTQAPASAG